MIKRAATTADLSDTQERGSLMPAAESSPHGTQTQDIR